MSHRNGTAEAGRVSASRRSWGNRGGAIGQQAGGLVAVVRGGPVRPGEVSQRQLDCALPAILN